MVFGSEDAGEVGHTLFFLFLLLLLLLGICYLGLLEEIWPCWGFRVAGGVLLDLVPIRRRGEWELMIERTGRMKMLSRRVLFSLCHYFLLR